MHTRHVYVQFYHDTYHVENIYTHTHISYPCACAVLHHGISMFVLATLVTLGQRLSTRFQCLSALLYGFAENTNAVKQA